MLEIFWLTFVKLIEVWGSAILLGLVFAFFIVLIMTAQNAFERHIQRKDVPLPSGLTPKELDEIKTMELFTTVEEARNDFS